MTKVYNFGARRPIENLEGVLDQMKLAHEFYQAMVEDRNKEREEALEPLKPFSPPHENCYEQRLEEAKKKSEELGKHVKVKRCSKCHTYWRAIYTKAFKNMGFYDPKPVRWEFANRGLYWGTYNAICEAFALADKKTKRLGFIKFRRWSEIKHAVVVQIQNSKRSDTMFRVEHIEDRFGRPSRWRMLWIRVGSNADRSPIWAKVPYKEHRPIDGNVTHVSVQRYFIADRECWEVLFTCKNEAPRKDLAHQGGVAVDVSWRKMEDGSIRAGYAQDLNGNVSELLLPPAWVERIARADRIQGHRSKNLNELLKATKLTHGIRSWKGVRRAYRRHLEGGGEPMPEVEKALARDRHLWQYEEGNRKRAVRRRRNDFRVWARALRRKYAILIIKDTRHKEVKEKANKGENKLPKKARNQGHNAAPGELVATLRGVFGWESKTRTGNVLAVEAEYTSRVCTTCKHQNEASEKLWVVCERCGAKDDRDRRSSRNMLDEALEGRVNFKTSRKKGARFRKRHKTDKTGSNASETA